MIIALLLSAVHPACDRILVKPRFAIRSLVTDQFPMFPDRPRAGVDRQSNHIQSQRRCCSMGIKAGCATSEAGLHVHQRTSPRCRGRRHNTEASQHILHPIWARSPLCRHTRCSPIQNQRLPFVTNHSYRKMLLEFQTHGVPIFFDRRQYLGFRRIIWNVCNHLANLVQHIRTACPSTAE